jgi:hypothetical protein
MGIRRVMCCVLVGRPEGRRKLGRSRLKWEDNIKIGLKNESWGHGLLWLRIGTGCVL